MHWAMKKFLIVFIFLVIMTLTYVMFVYEVPLRGIHHLLLTQRKNKTESNSNHAGGLVSQDGDEEKKDKAEKASSIDRTKVNPLNRSVMEHFSSKLEKSPSGTSASFYEPSSTRSITLKSQKLMKRLPDAIIIGSKKGGTRALLQFISVLPNVVVSQNEVHFFDKNYEKGINWYIEQFPMAYSDQIIMEKTPSYFVRPQVPERLYNLCKQKSLKLKFLLIVRDPVVRAISDYTQSSYRKKIMLQKKKRRVKRRSFESKVFLNEAARNVNRRNNLISIGLYSEHLKRWLKYFDLKQFHFISGEQLIKEPWKELVSVQKFLKIPVFITKDHFSFNKTKGFYCLQLRKVKNKAKLSSPRCFGDSKGRKHPFVDPKTISALRQFFRPFNNEFYLMVGRNFSWAK